MTLYPTYFLACNSKNSNRISGASSSKNTQRHVPAFQPGARSSRGETPAPLRSPPPRHLADADRKKRKSLASGATTDEPLQSDGHSKCDGITVAERRQPETVTPAVPRFQSVRTHARAHTNTLVCAHLNTVWSRDTDKH